MPAKDVTHPYLAGALMTDWDFMGYKRVIHKSHHPSIVALCDAVKNGWHGEIVPEASPKGESKSNGEVECAVQSVHGLARTLKDFLEQQSGITLESSKSAVGLAGRALFQSSPTLPRRSHSLHEFGGQALES